MRKLTLLLFMACMLSGCIEEYEADIASEDTDLLVVEGTICTGTSTFVLSRTQPLHSDDGLYYNIYTPYSSYSSNSPYSPYSSYYGPAYQIVAGAKVSVRGSNGTEYVAQEYYGRYYCHIDFLFPDVDYHLHIETGDEVYESEPQRPLRTEPIADVHGVQNTPESNIDVLVTPDAPYKPDQTNYYSWTYDETWLVYPDCTTHIFFDVSSNRQISKLNQFPERGWKDATSSTIMVGASTNYDGQQIRELKLYDIDRSRECMYHRYSGLVHQRAISKAEYEYELARRQAGSEMGGLFTPLPSALPTNIHCLTSRKHVIGFVGCSFNTSQYRFFLDGDDYSIDRPMPRDVLTWLDDCNEDDCHKMVERGMFLCDWQDERMKPGGKLRTAWAYEFQLDVRVKGAYIEKPDFWED